MRGAASFVNAVRAAAGELRLEPCGQVQLNQIAARIDQLGRRVHGLGWARDHEIGGCLSAAVGELSRAQELPERDRAGAVRRALHKVDEALVLTDE